MRIEILVMLGLAVFATGCLIFAFVLRYDIDLKIINFVRPKKYYEKFDKKYRGLA